MKIRNDKLFFTIKSRLFNPIRLQIQMSFEKFADAEGAKHIQYGHMANFPYVVFIIQVDFEK